MDSLSLNAFAQRRAQDPDKAPNSTKEQNMKIRFMGILTVEAALKAAENDPYALRYAPQESFTEQVALKAAEKNPDALQYAPQESFTEQVALKAAENDPDALQYVLNFELFKKVALQLHIEIET